MRIPLVLLSAGVTALASCSPPSEQFGRGGASLEPMPTAAAAPALQLDLLVSGEQLAAQLDDPGLVVLHVGSDRGAYERGHIPGARFLPVSAIVVERDGNTNELPSVAHLDSVFESLGVSDGSRVVVYGAPLLAARTFFTLDFLGHGARTALLDGGFEHWLAEDRPVTTEAPRVVLGSFNPRPQPERVVDAQWVSLHLDQPGIALVDARPAPQFTGEVAGEGVARPGHIPGAGNLFWEETIHSPEHPLLKDPEVLRAMFRNAGVGEGDRVVLYCRTGMQASFAYFVARYLGYDTRIYDASFMDWSRREHLPVER
jgi:thiosulfate/3-mercaptopyruvate sulfurtransferase